MGGFILFPVHILYIYHIYLKYRMNCFFHSALDADSSPASMKSIGFMLVPALSSLK